MMVSPEQVVEQTLQNGDVVASDWEEVLGCSWDEYTKPVQDAFERLKGKPHDRNDVIRDTFNATVRSAEGRGNWRALQDFYSGDFGIFARLLAYEYGSCNVLGNLIRSGVWQWEDEGRSYSVNKALELLHTRSERRLNLLDHGCGSGVLGMSLAAMQAVDGFCEDISVILYDYECPARRLIQRAICKYAPTLASHVEFVWVEEGPESVKKRGDFHLIISNEVMEHIPNPLYEVRWLRGMCFFGTYLYMSVFFDSSDGHDPQHLDEHHIYRNQNTWCDHVTEIGFALEFIDKNNVVKGWRAV